MNKLLMNVEDEKAFFIDGKSIKSLKELVLELKIMNEDVFRRYVNDEKNDFANWIKYVFGEEEFARKIYATKDRKEIINILNNEVEMAEKQDKKVVDFEFSKTEGTSEAKKENIEIVEEKKVERLETNIAERVEQSEQSQENQETSENAVKRAITTENLPKTKKPIIYFIIGFLLGLFIGIGGFILYLYKFKGLKIF